MRVGTQILTLICMKHMTSFLPLTRTLLKNAQSPVVNVNSASMYLGHVVLIHLQLAKCLLSGTQKMMRWKTDTFTGDRNSLQVL